MRLPAHPSKALALAITLASQGLYAEEMEVIEVEGHRLNGVSIVDLTDIQKKQANDLEDIFRDQPSITVGGSFGIAQKIYVRGIEDTNLNVSVDGATQAGYLFHHQGRLSIEPELLKQAELKAGAGTALDGPGALGGAIRFETKDAEDLLRPGEDFGALIKTGYYSNTEGYKASLNLYGRINDNWSGLLILGRNDTNEIEDGRGNTLANTSTEQELGLLKLNGEIVEGHKISLSHERRYDDGRRNLRPHFYDAPWNQTTDQVSRRETTTVNYEHDSQSDLIDLKISAFKTDNYLNQRDPSFDEGAGVESYGLNIRNSSQVGGHQLTYGMEYRDDRGYYINPNIEEDAKVYGLYVQDLFELNDTISISYGLRYDRYSLDDVDQQSFSASGFSPNANIEYKLDDAWSVRLGYSTALRGQKIKEAYLIGFRANHPDLKEEKANNSEISLQYQGDSVRGSLEVYRSEIEDVVGTVGTRATGRFFGNAGNLVTKGFALHIAKSWSQAELSMSYSRNEPELDGQPLDDGNLGIGTSFGDTLVINANYRFPDQNLELGWSGRFVQEMDDVQEDYIPKPAFNTQDVYLEWLPMGDEQLSVNLTVSNALDKYYLDHGTFGYDPDSQRTIGLPEPGRDMRLTLAYKF
ncbi:TonB-dependent receptor [uncultured Pseudoteredinibacter sp.]|uniref:TonB-dependent receptor domain-containing protein n=1 Tax=uncultured Pseudoteredinibacter sp. TaxID=1641701 RepID=UPI0026165FE8|nr:TonB-dependent receptor [uncultured Pseudoteredinibacter sp.]